MKPKTTGLLMIAAGVTIAILLCIYQPRALTIVCLSIIAFALILLGAIGVFNEVEVIEVPGEPKAVQQGCPFDESTIYQ